MISAGASTTFRNYAQGTQYGYQFAHGGWLSDNISSIESAGFTMGGRVLDLVAPGEANWALCSANVAVYEECTNFAGQGSPLQSFGGTSESAPFIAGGAALVIQSYRDTHHGSTPSPDLVRRLLTGTATDLHAPTVEQGAGELDTLNAVQAARTIAGGTGASGANLITDPTQLDIQGAAGSSASRDVRVTNVGTSAQTIHPHVGQVGPTTSNQTGAVTLDGSSPTFLDGFGVARPYAQVHFTVPAGADRLVAFDAWNGPQARVGFALIDPNGKYAAYTRPQGDGNHGEVDVQRPAAGQWTGIIFRRDGTFTGQVKWQAITQNLTGADSVSPSSVNLAPGQSATLHLTTSLPSGPAIAAATS